jgi:acetyl esterase/lipase
MIILSLLVQLSLSAQDFRYTHSVFSSSVKTANVTFANVPFLNSPYFNESNTSDADLLMDIYEPIGDTLGLRPAILFAHSGGFLTGDRMHDDMQAFCDSFARKGYVTATIDYRQGFYLLTNVDIHATRAAYRGLQDGRAAVRYLRANAQTYGIDTNKIYLAGSSAGAFISLHSIYMDQAAEKPSEAESLTYFDIIPPFVFNAPDLGPFDIGQNLSNNGEPNSIIALWGAVQDTLLISADNNEACLLIHGTDDATVPFDQGNPFGLGTIPEVDGSNLINLRLNHHGINNQRTYFVQGGDHEFYGTDNGNWENGSSGNVYWDTVLNESCNFLWKQHKPFALFDYSILGLQVYFSDNSQDAISWYWNFGDGQSENLQNPVHTYDSSGTYKVHLYIENEIHSWDTLSQFITVCDPIPNIWIGSDGADWNDTTSNWSLDEIPNNCHHVQIQEGDSVRISSGSHVQAFTLTVEEGAILVSEPGAVIDISISE